MVARPVTNELSQVSDWSKLLKAPASLAKRLINQFRYREQDSRINDSDVQVPEQNQVKSQSAKQGFVSLVGGGPGDPDLLTVKALRIIQQAEVIVYDYLISDAIMDLCNPNAQFIPVGKKAGNHTMAQDNINQLLVDLALEGKQVCRLKGGDPYIFGRGGEEAETLAKYNLPYQVIPGITAAAACSASASIPLTHRDYAQSLQFVTGHGKSSGSKQPNWQSLASSNQTLVVYMGVIKSQVIKQQLIDHGRDATTPVAIVEKGTRPDQRVVTGKLSELDELVSKHQIGSPALIIIGEVVELRSKLIPELYRQEQLETV